MKCEQLEREQRIVQQFHLVGWIPVDFFLLLSSVPLGLLHVRFGRILLLYVLATIVCCCLFFAAAAAAAFAYVAVNIVCTAASFSSLYFLLLFFCCCEVYSTLTIFLFGCFSWTILYVKVMVFHFSLFVCCCVVFCFSLLFSSYFGFRSA